MNQPTNNQQGFTLIELILYIAIVTIVISTIVPFAWNIIGGGTKSNTQQEVSSNARFISERIKHEIRNASGINNLTPTSLSLANSDSSLNPTVINLSGSNIVITQGANPQVNLNSTDIKITTLTFTNYSSSDQKTKHVGFTLTVEANYPNASQEFQASTTIESSAEVRSN